MPRALARVVMGGIGKVPMAHPRTQALLRQRRFCATTAFQPCKRLYQVPAVLWSLTSGSVRNVAITLLWVVIVLLASIEALSHFGVLLTMVFQGPRGVVGQLAHVAFQGHWFPSSAAESDRIFWSYTATVLALHFTGLVVLWVAWGLKKKLTATPASPTQAR